MNRHDEQTTYSVILCACSIKDVFFCSLDPPVQDPVLLAEPLPVSPVLLGEQPAWWILRGAPQLQLPIRTQPLSVAAALLCGGRIGLCRVCAGQPHPLWELQSGFCPHTGRLQAHGGWLHGELPGIRDGPPGFGVGLPVTESWPQARGRLFFLISDSELNPLPLHQGMLA